MSIIYVLDFPNGKRYIGKTVDADIRARFHKHVKVAESGASFAVSRAIRKFSSHKVQTAILFRGEIDDELLCLVEQEAIDKWKTKAPLGYNLTDGGEGVVGHAYSIESKRRMSAGQKARFSAEASADRKALSESAKKTWSDVEKRKKLLRNLAKKWNTHRAVSMLGFSLLECLRENRPFSDLLGVLKWQK